MPALIFLQSPSLPDCSTLCPYEFAFSGPSEPCFLMAARHSVRRRAFTQQPCHCPWTSKLSSFLLAMFTSASFTVLAESPGSHLRAIKRQHQICNCVELFACLCGTCPWNCREDLNQIPNPTATALWGPAVAPRNSSSSC